MGFRSLWLILLDRRKGQYINFKMENQMGFNFFMGYWSTNAKVVSRRWKHELKEVLLFPSRNTILHFT